MDQKTHVIHFLRASQRSVQVSGDMLSGDVVSWTQNRYLRRDERTNYHHISHQSTFSLALLLQ